MNDVVHVQETVRLRSLSSSCSHESSLKFYRKAYEMLHASRHALPAWLAALSVQAGLMLEQMALCWTKECDWTLFNVLRILVHHLRAACCLPCVRQATCAPSIEPSSGSTAPQGAWMATQTCIGGTTCLHTQLHCCCLLSQM